MFLPIPHPHYFSYKTNKEVKEIYLFTVINGLGLALVYIFEPIYLFHIGLGLPEIMWFYVQVYCWYAALMLLGAKFASKFGLKHSILISNFFYILYWTFLFLVGKNIIFFAIAPLFYALQKSFFWPAFNTYTSLSSVQTQRSRQVGVIYVITDIAYIIGPLIGGAVSQILGFMALFVLASVVVLVSVVPLFLSRDIRITDGFSIKYFLNFVSRNPKNFFSYWGYAEDLMLMSLWPVFMFIIVGRVFGVGLITTFATLLAAVLMLYVGKLADKLDKHKIIEAGSFFYGLTWLFRFTAASTVSVIIFDAFTKLGKSLVSIPVASLTFETARLKGSNFTLLYGTFLEFSLSIAKIFTALASITILNLTNNIYLVFAMVGVMVFFYSFLTKKINVH